MLEKITELSAEDARVFFLKQKCYTTMELPKYFDFSEMLKKLARIMENKTLEDIALKEESDSKGKKPIKSPSHYNNVNYTIYQNKDGNLAWRKMQLINPVLYVYLVNIITDKGNWDILKRHFIKCSYDKRLECCSIPIEMSDQSEIITNWWESIEQKSIELSLEYDWLAVTDITDCYSSIYTHSIAWAIHGKKKCKYNINLSKNEKENLLGDNLDSAIRLMTHNQTNGIPQGSILMDFIAEIVLGYSDRILLWRIYKAKITEFKILRYRDDYRIFTKSKEDAVKILRILSEVSMGLNFKLNAQKTFISQELIVDSIKPDKLYWNESKQTDTTLQKHLLLIHKLAKEHTNTGSISKALTDFMERINPIKTKIQNENITVLIAILADIAVHNSKVYALVATIIAKLIAFELPEIKEKSLRKVIDKLQHLPNVGFLLIWLQRMTIKSEFKLQECESELLCKIFETKNNKELWNNEWLKKTYKDIVENTSIINERIINEMPEIPDDNEVKLFINRY